jgi:hypothetical protein
MGVSGSFLKYAHEKCAEHVFVDESLRKACRDMKQSSSTQAAFVRYIKAGSWQDSFEWREEKSGAGRIWEQYAYRPCFSRDSEFESLNSASTSSSRSGVTDSSSGSEKAAHAHSIALTPSKEPSIKEQSTVFATLCDKMSLLVMVLLPMFLSEGSIELTVSSASSDKHDEGKGKASSNKSGKRQRIRDVLMSIVATCGEAELLSYLAAPKGNPIADFLSAVARLPVRLMVAKIDHKEHTTPVRYLNFQPEEMERLVMGLEESQQEVTGQDLHVLYGNMCAPGTAHQLERAVFSGKTFKKNVVLPNDYCKLLAVCPIASRNGEQPLYAVSLESQPFRDPDLFSPSKRHMYFIERHFQQVEELLALMPLLIRE